MTKFLLGGAALVAMVAIAPATAQIAQAPMAQRAPAVQVHTRAQVGAQVATMFQRLDTDRDGFITKAESQAARQQRQVTTALRRPGEHVGGNVFVHRVDRGGGGAAFDRLDSNNDGQISRQEWNSGRASREQRVAMRRQGGAKGRGMRMGMGGLRGHMFDMADANRDGRVTLQEATGAALQHFDMADANRDGQVTREERMQMRQRMRAERRPG